LFEKFAVFALFGYKAMPGEILRDSIYYNPLALGVGIGNKLGGTFFVSFYTVYFVKGKPSGLTGSSNGYL
jgi:hypothetical protein